MPKTFTDRNVRVTRDQVGSRFWIQYIDRDTGEILAAYWEEHAKNPRGRSSGSNGKKPYFIKLYRTNMQDIVKRKVLKPYSAGMFLMMIAYMDWESCFIVNPDTNAPFNESSFAAFMDMSQSQMHETMHELRQQGFISRLQGKDGAPAHILINPNIAFWGSKMKDVRNQDHFTSETCAYKPKIIVKYRPMEKFEPEEEK